MIDFPFVSLPENYPFNISNFVKVKNDRYHPFNLAFITESRLKVIFVFSFVSARGRDVWPAYSSNKVKNKLKLRP